ncbi:hypothetical protein NKH77_08370 [Streptomyces sp. M19]
MSAVKEPDIPGADTFAGRALHTADWPHEGVDLSGERVAVIGTGCSGVQAIPLLAEQAAALTVFQRTPVYAIPAHNRPLSAEENAELKARYPRFRIAQRQSRAAPSSSRPPGRPCRSTPRSGPPRTRRVGSRACSAVCCGRTTTCSSTRTPTRPSPSSSAPRSVRSSPTPRRPRRSPARLPVRHQTPLPGHRLLHHVQQAARRRRGPHRDPDPGDHAQRHQDLGAGPRGRRDRLRHRLRRDDRIAGRHRHRRQGRHHPAGEVGRRPAQPPGPPVVRLPQPLHRDRPAEPVRAQQRGGGHRAARGVDHRLRGAPARGRPDRDRRHGGGRGGVVRARRRPRRPDALPGRRLLVHRSQRAGQTTGVPGLHGRPGPVPGAVRRRRPGRLPRLQPLRGRPARRTSR